MASVDEKIRELEEELRKTPYNKATQYHIGLLKAKIAKLKRDKEIASKKGGKGPSYAIKKSGDATALLVGFPSVGKSTLLNQLTNAESKVGGYDFTTLHIIPGMMEYKGAKIQLLDVPGLIEGASSGRGRGKEIMSVVRSADLIIIVADATQPEQVSTIEKELYNANLRLNKKRPDVIIKKKVTGGINITSTVTLTHMNKDLIKKILMEYNIHNADVIIKQDITIDELIDVLSKNRVYVPAIIVYNKSDLPHKKMSNGIYISAEKGDNLDELRELIYNALGFLRIYMKKIGEEPDMKQPLIARKGDTIKDICEKLHKDFVQRFKFARIWGPSAKFDGQIVGLNHELMDEDIVELHIRR
ncbi:MAG: GTP-binding protein [Candidatus Diapherotrites archaeon]|nr:GTP-binding protein [Candidatus Diapherotrites archaeon]